MDIPRTDQHLRRRRRWLIMGSIATVSVAAAAGLAQLQPAPPTVDRSQVWIDTVKRGPMLLQVRGVGTLVPEDTTWITARTVGRVQRILLHPGAVVKPDDVILVLSNPDVRQGALDADSQLRAAEAEVVNAKAQLQSAVLAAEASAAAAKAEYEQAKLRAEVNDRLFQNGLVSELEWRSSKVTAEQTQTHSSVEEKRFAFARDSTEPQLAVKRAAVEHARAQALLRHEELEALDVRAGISGVLQVLQVEAGAQVAAGVNLARVADPLHLKAAVRIAETQAKDIQIGQPASIDTHNGIIEGRVARVDPSVLNGTVTVDVQLTQALPLGARPDLSVDGTIELARLGDVVYVSRPAFGEEGGTVAIFRLDPQDKLASRTRVRFGRGSVNSIEVINGLTPGDRVILSDTSQWIDREHIRLN